MRPLKDWGHYVGDAVKRKWGVPSADWGIRSAEYKTQDKEMKEIRRCRDEVIGRVCFFSLSPGGCVIIVILAEETIRFPAYRQAGKVLECGLLGMANRCFLKIVLFQGHGTSES